MARLFFLCCFFVSVSFAFSQNTFPGSFIGHWEGTLQWYQAGKKNPQKIKMQLIITPEGVGNSYGWQIVYGDKGEDSRPYSLKPVDTVKGHWQIDEHNGIIIDQYFIGNRFTSVFTVQTTTIVNTYWKDGNNLIAEFYSVSAKPVSTTGNGTEESPKVDSYAAKGYQRAVLKRKK